MTPDEARREYRRRYCREHPDKVKQWQLTYWNKKAKEYEAEQARQTKPEK